MSIEPIEVFAVGSDVLLDGVHSARVAIITIQSGEMVRYTVVWWAEGTRYCEEVDAWELTADGDKARTLRVNQVL